MRMRRISMIAAIFALAALAGAAPAADGAFEFSPDKRRDPFTFDAAASFSVKPPHDPPVEIERIRALAADLGDKAGEAFMAGDPAQAVAACDQALHALAQFPELSRHREAMELSERLRNLHRAGETLRQRQIAGAKLQGLGIRLAGMINRPRQPLALINGKAAKRGETVAMDGNHPVTVCDIREDGVIVAYRGYKFRLSEAGR